MNTPNTQSYVAPTEYATCPDCKVTHRTTDLTDGTCTDRQRCMRWQVEAKVKEALAVREAA